MEQKVLLPVRSFRQKGYECAICASCSMANYYDKNVSYQEVRKTLTSRERNGMYTAGQAMLLNRLGFNYVSIVTNDLSIVDYSWSKLPKNKLIKKLKRLKTHIKRSMSHVAPHSIFCSIQKTRDQNVKEIIRWLENETYDNNIIIDYDFPKYIRKSLDQGHPVGVSVNATSLFKQKKGGTAEADIKGETMEHALVLRGYDSKGVYVVDSDLGRFTKSGYYKISWQKLLTNMPYGDLILVG